MKIAGKVQITKIMSPEVSFTKSLYYSDFSDLIIAKLVRSLYLIYVKYFWY